MSPKRKAEILERATALAEALTDKGRALALADPDVREARRHAERCYRDALTVFLHDAPAARPRLLAGADTAAIEYARAFIRAAERATRHCARAGIRASR